MWREEVGGNGGKGKGGTERERKREGRKERGKKATRQEPFWQWITR